MGNFSQFHPPTLSVAGSSREITAMSDAADFFRRRLDQMIDLRHLRISEYVTAHYEIVTAVAGLMAGGLLGSGLRASHCRWEVSW